MSDAEQKLQQGLDQARAELEAKEAEYRDALAAVEANRSALLFMLEDLERERHQIEFSHREWIAAFDAMRDAVFLHDQDFRILKANRAYADLAGKGFKELIGQPYWTMFPKGEGPLHSCLECRKGNVNAAEEEIILETGQVFLSRAFPVYDDGGSYLYSVHVMEDVTERRRMQQAIEDNEKRFRSLVENASDIITVLDRDGQVLYGSPSTKRLLGWEPDQLVGRSVFDLLHPDDAPLVAQSLSEAVRDPQKLQSAEVRFRHSDGSWRSFEAFGRSLLEEPVVGGVVINARDVTEHRLAERAVKKERDTAQRYLDIAGVMLLAIDPDGVVTLVNKKGAEILGYPVQEIVGRPWVDRFVPERVRPEIGNILTRTLAGEMEWVEYYENPVLTRTGEERILAWHNSPLTDEAGRVVGVLSSGEDITERKQAETGLLAANRRLTLLSACNQALVHTKDEIELLRTMCRIVVQTGGFRMAWAAFSDGEGRAVAKPVAHASVEEGFPGEENSAAWSGERCLPVVAIRTGQVKISQDILTDPDAAPWREISVKRGYASAAALPLTDDDQPFGVLTVYAGETNAFNPQETALLEELSGDLAFGIVTLRNEVKRKLAEQERAQGLQRLRQALEETVQAIATTLELRDPYTAGHQRRVAQLAVAIAQEMGLPQAQLDGIHFGGLIHDLGKIQIPAEILSKPGSLTDLEQGFIRTHPEAGYNILKDVQFPWPIAQMVLQHHERMDGSGYPQGLKGDDILLEARVLAVADVLEAMSTHRPYRPGLGPEVAIAEITRGRGQLYDPDVVDAYMRLFSGKRFRFSS
jgi:PAS domain S-box-containing protein/putative nucleotidyltransferase with HDIG domain